MKFYIGYEHGAGNSKPIFDAFVRGVTLLGYTVSHDYRSADVCVIWSILFSGRMAGNKAVWEHCDKTGKPCIVLEIGALKRGESWKVGINGINNIATWCDPWQENRLQNRFNIELKPWKTGGEFITVMTQRTDSQQWSGMPSLDLWLKETIEDIRIYTDGIIVVRPHPRQPPTPLSFLKNMENVYFDLPIKLDGTYDSYNHGEIFERSKVVVNYSSGPGIQAAIAGIPCLTSHDSLAWDVSMKSAQFIDSWEPVDRTEWANKLAHTEFFIDEIESGEVLQHLLQKYEIQTHKVQTRTT